MHRCNGLSGMWRVRFVHNMSELICIDDNIAARPKDLWMHGCSTLIDGEERTKELSLVLRLSVDVAENRMTLCCVIWKT